MCEEENDKEIINREIEYKIKVKCQGTEPVITDIKKIVENGLFESCDGLYRVTSISSDKELEDLEKEMENQKELEEISDDDDDE